MNRKIAETANAAADYIEKVDWTQGEYENELGQVCLVGGIQHVTVKPRLNDETYSNYIDTTNALSNHLGVSHLPKWNDELGRTKEEVIQALRDVAVKYMPDEMRVES